MTTFFINLLITFLFPILFAFVGNALEWLFDMFTKPFNFTATAFIGLLGKDLPNIIIKIMISFGIAIAILIFLINIYKTFFAGSTSRIESPISMSFRFVGSVFLCYWMVDIIYELIFPVFQFFLDKITNITVKDGTAITQKVADIFNFKDVESTFKSLGSFAIDATAIGTFSRVLFLVLFIILLFMIISNMIKLVGEIIERYLLINVLTLCSPLVSATIVSKTTMPIFISWCQMMIANGLVIIFNALGFIMVHVAFVNLSLENVNNVGNIIVSFFAISALIKVVQKFDTYLAQLTFKIQAINGNGKGLSIGSLLAGGKLNKQADRIASAGGIKNYMGSQASNLFGVFGGNRDGVAGEIGKNARAYKSRAVGEDKGMGMATFSASEMGKEAEMKKMDAQIRNLNDPDYIQKQAALNAAKESNKEALNQFEPLTSDNDDSIKNPQSLNEKDTYAVNGFDTLDQNSENDSDVKSTANADIVKNVTGFDSLENNSDFDESGNKINAANSNEQTTGLDIDSANDFNSNHEPIVSQHNDVNSHESNTTIPNHANPDSSLNTFESVDKKSESVEKFVQSKAHINEQSSAYYEQSNSAMERTKNYLEKKQYHNQTPYDSSMYERYVDPEQKSNQPKSKSKKNKK